MTVTLNSMLFRQLLKIWQPETILPGNVSHSQFGLRTEYLHRWPRLYLSNSAGELNSALEPAVDLVAARVIKGLKRRSGLAPRHFDIRRVAMCCALMYDYQ